MTERTRRGGFRVTRQAPRGGRSGQVVPRTPLNIPGQNRLLTALPPDVRARVQSLAERVPLKFKQVLQEPDRPIPYAYFLLDGVYSVLTDGVDGGMVETATIGNEGFMGVPLLLGTDSSPATSLCQIPGEALRIDAETFKQEVESNKPLRTLLLRFAQGFFDFAAQSAACNRTHNIEKRCARWLLLTRDRVATDNIPLTHEFLSQMLGVRRAGVTVAAGILQKAGLIAYARGIIRVIDRDGLHKASCGCYDIVQRNFQRLLG